VVTVDELERLTRRTIAALRGLSAVQRDQLVTRILESDPELGAVELAGVLSLYRRAKQIRRLGPLIRDGVI
jgi:hypothetical protein